MKLKDIPPRPFPHDWPADSEELETFLLSKGARILRVDDLFWTRTIKVALLPMIGRFYWLVFLPYPELPGLIPVFYEPQSMSLIDAEGCNWAAWDEY